MSYNPNNPNGQAVSASSAPVVIASDQSAVSTSMPDLYVTGQATQTATVNNILTASSGTAATDLSGYHSSSVQVTSTGTAGTYIFEGSNDNVNFQAIPVYSQLILTGTPVTAAITATATQLIYSFPASMRYVRLRIATTITGGSIQAFSKFSQSAWSPSVYQVAQATAANLNATVTAANLSSNIAQIGGTTTVNGGVAGVLSVGGNVAHSSAATANPVQVGGRAITTLDTTLVNNDVSYLFLTTAGQLVQKPYGTSENDWQATSGITPLAVSTSTQVKAAGAASVRNYVTGAQFYNNSATVSTTVSILDGASVIWTGYLPATTAALPVVAVEVNFPTPLRGTAATAMNIQLGTTASSVFYNLQGYQSF